MSERNKGQTASRVSGEEEQIPAKNFRPPHRMRFVRMIAIVLISGIVALSGMSLTYPPLAAEVCPNCMGFNNSGDQIFVEQGMPAVRMQEAVETIGLARDRVRNFYRDVVGKPDIFVCGDDDCYRRIGGGGSRGMALLDIALFLSPRGNTVTIAAHELSHIELHRRIGITKAYRHMVPQWFDEGLAVFVSDDGRYLKPASAEDRCLASLDGPMPATREAWVESAQTSGLYAKAACRVSRWISGHGGSDAVIALLQAVANGTSFAEAYDRSDTAVPVARSMSSLQVLGSR